MINFTKKFIVEFIPNKKEFVVKTIQDMGCKVEQVFDFANGMIICADQSKIREICLVNGVVKIGKECEFYCYGNERNSIRAYYENKGQKVGDFYIKIKISNISNLEFEIKSLNTLYDNEKIT